MLLKDLKKIFHNELDAIYGENEVRSLFFILIESYFGISRLELALQPELAITTNEHPKIMEALSQLKSQYPIQYILKETEFYGFPFKVTANTLIPRPETEELVTWVYDSVKAFATKTEHPKLVDIGTGSGCIAISLAKLLPKAQVSAIDVSKAALQVAKQNAKRNNVKINFIEASVLEPQPEVFSEGLDIIVSNPPYVRELEKQEMKPNVLDNEPHLALFVENDNALQFYTAIIDFSKLHLKENGLLFFEINESLGQEMIALLKENDFTDIELRKDMFGKDRMIKGVKS
ncbi:peptide chain release factor N(5)-glutamine methyltransferase [Bizionia saleffrena]|uniref:Release factor glutamine methyltransferase n=1 Tax=Bizionia saleffrena TaxID=291189 RepID=A0A8H2QG21_9FLAO|nr:peptide chain release factor N(5)-glutamine methyltransferase [Bizionia saleffrena]TYB77382.1 peptide chain release factor N(5)-glutamine methyltransferase [Bizionia saleffrena]